MQLPVLSRAIIVDGQRVHLHLAAVLHVWVFMEGLTKHLLEDLVLLGRLQFQPWWPCPRCLPPQLCDALAVFYSTCLACRQAVLAHCLDSVWSLTLVALPPFLPHLFPGIIVNQVVLAVAFSSRPIDKVLLSRDSAFFRGSLVKWGTLPVDDQGWILSWVRSPGCCAS